MSGPSIDTIIAKVRSEADATVRHLEGLAYVAPELWPAGWANYGTAVFAWHWPSGKTAALWTLDGMPRVSLYDFEGKGIDRSVMGAGQGAHKHLVALPLIADHLAYFGRCLHLADSDEPGESLSEEPCSKCGRYYVDDSDGPSPLCDCCGAPTGPDYATDDEVCGNGDGPGFTLCGRCAGGRKLDGLGVEERRALYTERRAINEAMR